MLNRILKNQHLNWLLGTVIFATAASLSITVLKQGNYPPDIILMAGFFLGIGLVQMDKWLMKKHQELNS